MAVGNLCRENLKCKFKNAKKKKKYWEYMKYFCFINNIYRYSIDENPILCLASIFLVAVVKTRICLNIRV